MGLFHSESIPAYWLMPVPTSEYKKVNAEEGEVLTMEVTTLCVHKPYVETTGIPSAQVEVDEEHAPVSPYPTPKLREPAGGDVGIVPP